MKVKTFEEVVLNPIIKNISDYPNENAFCISEKYYSYKQLGEKISYYRSMILNYSSSNNIFGLAFHDDLDTYASILALWAEGKSYVPLHPGYPVERNQSIIEQVNPSAIIYSDSDVCYDGFKAILPDRSTNRIETEKPIAEFDGDRIAYILFTSGSTGVPKGVPISRDNLCSFISSINEMGYNISQKDRCLQCFDLTFDLSVFSYVYPLINGACVYTIPHNKIKWSQAYFLMAKYNITAALMTPSTLNYLKPYYDEINLPSLKWSLFCGEALPTSLVDGWSKCCPNATIDNVYGPTENTIFCTCYRYVRNDNNVEHNGVLSIGKDIPQTHSIIINENGEKVSESEIGELCLAGGQLTMGYWNNSGKNKSAFFTYKNGEIFYRTGDLCFFEKDGNIQFVGRKDTQVKINGYRIELGEIECKARELAGGKACIAQTYSEIDGTNAIALFIEGFTENVDVLKNNLKSVLTPYMIPTKIISMQSFPVNSSNKIDRKELKKYLI